MASNSKILIVDDDKNICEIVRLYLLKEGYEVKCAYAGKQALKMIEEEKPSAVILDIMLPEIDGIEILKQMRQTTKIPVIMLTAKGETIDKILGLELGADDYVVKPFEPKELIARVKAILRRTGAAEEPVSQYSYENLTVNISDYTVLYHGKELEMPPKEIELLYFLASHPNKVFTREQLLEQVWGFEYFGDSRTVDVHVKRIREKMPEEDLWSIKTVWGIGYKFEVKQ